MSVTKMVLDVTVFSQPVSNWQSFISECDTDTGYLYRGNNIPFEGNERRVFAYIEDCRSACKAISAPYFSYNINSFVCQCKSARSPDSIESDSTYTSGGSSCNVLQAECTTCNVQCTTDNTTLPANITFTNATFTNQNSEDRGLSQGKKPNNAGQGKGNNGPRPKSGATPPDVRWHGAL